MNNTTATAKVTVQRGFMTFTLNNTTTEQAYYTNSCGDRVLRTTVVENKEEVLCENGQTEMRCINALFVGDIVIIGGEEWDVIAKG